MAANASASGLAMESTDLKEQIRKRAFEIYLQRGDQPGSELTDWLQAEEEIMRSYTAAPSSIGKKARTHKQHS